MTTGIGLIARVVLLGCAVLMGCKSKEPGTQVMVVIDAEASVRSRVFDVDVVVKSGQGDASTWTSRYEMRLTQGSGEVPWPLEVALIPRDGDTSRNYSVEATARGESGGVLAVVRAISGYVEGRSLSLPLVFDEKCLALESLCDTPLTCLAGHCMDPFVEPSKLLPFEPGRRPADDVSAAGAGDTGSGGSSGESGSSGSGTSGSGGGDGAVAECADETVPCEPDPMIVCNDERCAGCPASFLRLPDGSCTPLLIGLGLSKGALAPALNTEDVRYDIAVPLLTDAITFTAGVPDGVTIEINGEALGGDERSFTARNLPIGESTYVMALRAAGHDSRTYTFKVTRSGAQRTFLKAHNTGEGDNFGYAVALRGDTIVIGAPGEDSSSKDQDSDNNLRFNSGAAYVMVREGPSYRQAAYLKAEPILADGAFGTAIAFDGERIAIGAPDEAGGGGSVYVYRRAGSDWVLEARLAASQLNEDQRFGASVALVGDVLAVGAPGDNTFATACGAVYLHTRSGTSWAQGEPIGPAQPTPHVWFGSSVAIQGDALFVGATGESNDIWPRGALYVLERVGGSYVERQRIAEPDAGMLDFFGESVAIEGETLVVGSFGASGAVAGNGSIYIYAPSSQGWALEQRIGASNPTASAGFGLRVALLGDLIVTGAPYEDSGAQGVNDDLSVAGRENSGAGYVLKRSGSRWSQLAHIKAEPPEVEDRYGWSVAAEGDTIVFGAPYESSSATDVDGDALENGATASGAVYVVR